MIIHLIHFPVSKIWLTTSKLQFRTPQLFFMYDKMPTYHTKAKGFNLMTQIRMLNSQDQLSTLLQFWNRNANYDPMPAHILLEKTFGDPNFNPDLTLLTIENGTILGFMQGLVRQIEPNLKRG